MSDKTSFLFKPILRESDLDYVRAVIKRNEVLTATGLDHTSNLHGYYMGVLQFGQILGILFWRHNAASVVFVYQQLCSLGDWRWIRGFVLGDDQDGPDFNEAVQEMHGLVIAEEDLCPDEVSKVEGVVAQPAGSEAKSEAGKVEISIGCCARPKGLEARADSGDESDAFQKGATHE
jgi:hypothetical protein